MSNSPIKILRAGKNTNTMLRFVNGVSEHTIQNVGQGTFFPAEYASQADARTFCDANLERDPSAIFYIVFNDKILETVLNLGYQREKTKMRRKIYSVVSTAVVFATALSISLCLMPFLTPLEHSLFTGGMTLLYVAALFVYGAGNFEPLVFMFILFVLIALLVPAVMKARKLKQTRQPTSVEVSRHGFSSQNFDLQPPAAPGLRLS